MRHHGSLTLLSFRAQREVCCALIVALAAAAPESARGQSRPTVTVDATTGLQRAIGGIDYAHRAQFSFDATLAARAMRRSNGSMLVAVSASRQPRDETVCLDTAIPGGGCKPRIPAMYSFSAMAGVENASGHLRFLVGGGSFEETDHRDRAFGAIARVDWALPLTESFAVILTSRGAVLPNFQGRTLGLASIGVGLGFW